MGSEFCGPNTQGAIGTDGIIQDTAEHARKSRQRQKDTPLVYSANVAFVCVCGPYGRDCLSRRLLEKAVIRDCTP